MRPLILSVSMLLCVGCASSPDVDAPATSTDSTEPSPPSSEKKDDRAPAVALPPIDMPEPMPRDRMCPVAHPDESAALALMWSHDAAASPSPAAVVESRGVTRAEGCMVRVGIAKIVSPTSTWTIYLEKRNLHDDEETCLQPTGYRKIAESFVEPHALMASHFGDGRLFAIAYDVKPTPDAPVEMRLVQYDWATGDELRHAVMAVEGHEPNVPPVGAPFSLNVNDCDLTLYGDGVFPGASGTNVGVWRATFPGFLGDGPQMPMSASKATYEYGQ